MFSMDVKKSYLHPPHCSEERRRHRHRDEMLRATGYGLRGRPMRMYVHKSYVQTELHRWCTVYGTVSSIEWNGF
jgi:hypothetical protein